jgi:hypothetical protein
LAEDRAVAREKAEQSSHVESAMSVRAILERIEAS